MIILIAWIRSDHSEHDERSAHLAVLLILLENDQRNHLEQRWLDTILLYLYNDDYSLR